MKRIAALLFFCCVFLYNKSALADAAAAAEGAAPWRALEGMDADYIRHLAGVAVRDAIERAATFARERME